MLRLIIVVLLASVSLQANAQYNTRRAADAAPQGTANVKRSNAASDSQRGSGATGQYKCDGRIYCSQMTSCAEATYFLRSCPGVKMDGDNDGIPCEKQWCRP